VETEDLDFKMSNRVRECQDIEQTINGFHESLKTACENAFRRSQAPGKTTNNRSISWWKGEETVMRKHTNALRRRYQMTRTNGGLREKRKTRYKKSQL
jgi:hypothetical protein